MNSTFENWIKNNLDSQHGKTILITGGNAGIGYQTALALAKAGASVVITGRNGEKIEKAKRDIEAEGIEGDITTGIIDLASLKSVTAFANSFKQNHNKLDVLINNAGVMMLPASKTEEGFETQFGVNFIGHFALTGHLFELLKHTPNSRIVSVSSIAHRGASIDFDNLRLEKDYDERREYYQSKLANIMFTLELDRKQGDRNPISVGCHPGVAKTELQRHVDPALLARFEFMEDWQGSLPSIVAATSGEVKGGQYYGPDGPGEMSGYPALGVIDDAALDEKTSKRLWEEAEKITGITFPE